MTVRLLCAYDKYPANAIVTLDAGTEAGLVAAKQADTNLAGGVAFQPSVRPSGDTVPREIDVVANTFVLLGDSITANNNVVTTAQRWRQSTGYFTAANILLGQRAIVVNDAGVPGNTTSQMLARVSTDVLPYEPAFCVVLGGINDIAAGSTAIQIIANLQSIYEALRADGITVVACTIMPSSLRITTTALHTLLHTVNQWVKDYCETTKGMLLADFHAAFVNPATGAEVAGFSGDQLHPNTAGAWNLGRCLYEVLDPLLPKLRLLASSPTDRKNLIYNPLASGSNASGVGGYTGGTGITGSAGPNGWTAARTATGAAVVSKVSRTDFWQGDFARLAVTATALGDGAYWNFLFTSPNGWFGTAAYQLGALLKNANGFGYRCTTAGTTGGVQPTWPTTVGQQVTDGTVTWTCVDYPAVGDTLEGFVEFEASNFSGAAAIYAYIQVLDGGSPVFLSGDNVYNGDGLTTYVPARGVLRIPKFTIPYVSSTLLVQMRVLVVAAAGVTGNLDVTRAFARITNR